MEERSVSDTLSLQYLDILSELLDDHYRSLVADGFRVLVEIEGVRRESRWPVRPTGVMVVTRPGIIGVTFDERLRLNALGVRAFESAARRAFGLPLR